MTILAQQQIVTFPLWDGDLELWQPEEVMNYKCPPFLVPPRFTIPTETCPWTDHMIQDLWNAMLSENNNTMALLTEEIQGWDDLDELVKGQVIDINEPSYFCEWNQSADRVAFVCDARGIAQKFTPEMLVQRDNLNDMWNANCQLEDENRPGGQIWGAEPIYYVPDSHCTLEFVSIGEKFGVAKCEYGSVFVPKSSIKHIKNLLGHEPTVGQMFGAQISFSGNAKYPWRIEGTIGVTEIY